MGFPLHAMDKWRQARPQKAKFTAWLSPSQEHRKKCRWDGREGTQFAQIERKLGRAALRIDQLAWLSASSRRAIA